jgi:hypothetical protein
MHWERCVADVTSYAKGLRCNEQAVDGLLWSYLQRPAFYPEWRHKLHAVALRARAALVAAGEG